MNNIDLNKPHLLTRESVGAVFFAAAGIYFLSNGGWFLGCSGLLLAVSIGFLYKGLGFDLPGKRYRVYTGLFNWRFGTWEVLPPISGVTVKYFSEFVTSGKPGRMRTDQVGYYVLMLSVINAQQGIILQRFGLNQKEYVVEIGEKIAEVFQVTVAIFLH